MESTGYFASRNHLDTPIQKYTLPLLNPELDRGTHFTGRIGKESLAQEFAEFHPLARLLLQIILIAAAAGLCGFLFRRIGQPSVSGEMAAGIALGPLLLGFFWQAAYQVPFRARFPIKLNSYSARSV